MGHYPAISMSHSLNRRLYIFVKVDFRVPKVVALISADMEMPSLDPLVHIIGFMVVFFISDVDAYMRLLGSVVRTNWRRCFILRH